MIPPEAPPRIPVRFEVILPDTTPAGPIYLSGNLPEAGSWKADGMMLTRIDDTIAIGALLLPADTPLEFKITRGTWETVEKGQAFEEIQNHKIVVSDTALLLETPLMEMRIRVTSWSDQRPAVPPTFTGTIQRHDGFASTNLGNQRTLLVYLPPGYDSKNDRYPVLYVHDGQNIFDANMSFTGVEWGVDERCEELIKSEAMEPIIVVGVYNAGGARMDEYSPDPDQKRGGGHGELYAKFLIEEVKPFIDTTYRTLPDRDHTAVMGSSMGGLISLYLVWEHADVFSKAAAVSPSLWWADRKIIQRIESSAPSILPAKLWVDMGTAESLYPDTYLDDFRSLGTILEGKGLKPDASLIVRVFDGADHSERAWAARTADILKFLFGR